MWTDHERPADDATVLAVLRGGPEDIPKEQRVCYTQVDRRKIKLIHRGGYEHFERDEVDSGDTRPVVFWWTTRTRMAE